MAAGGELIKIVGSLLVWLIMGPGQETEPDRCSLGKHPQHLYSTVVYCTWTILYFSLLHLLYSTVLTVVYCTCTLLYWTEVY